MVQTRDADELLASGEPSSTRPPLLPVAGNVVVALFVLAGAAVFVHGNFAWMSGFWTSLGHFMRDPTTQVHWRLGVPPGAFGLTIGLGIDLVLAWLTTRELLRSTPYRNDKPTTIGLVIIVAVSMLGLFGTIAIVIGTEARWFFALCAVLVGGAHVAVWARRRSRSASPTQTVSPVSGLVAPPPRYPASWTTRLLVLFCVLVIGLIALQAALSPVSAWDSLIYHAELPRLWFQQAPAPKLIFGPSVGIELSANYPPLYPAFGAAMYVLAGTADDLFLRLAGPVLLVALLFLVFGVARAHFTVRAARWAVLLVVASPLLLIYSVWPTNYLLTACLVFVSVVFLSLAQSTPRPEIVVGAGLFAGLAGLADFFGWSLVPAGVVVPCCGRSRSDATEPRCCSSSLPSSWPRFGSFVTMCFWGTRCTRWGRSSSTTGACTRLCGIRRRRRSATAPSPTGAHRGSRSWCEKSRRCSGIER
jgi:hypothetical protein